MPEDVLGITYVDLVHRQKIPSTLACPVATETSTMFSRLQTKV